jgi:hypothetical protein
MLRRAPTPNPEPLPFNRKTLLTPTPPINSNVAPLDTVVTDELPNPPRLLKRKKPALTLVVPLYTFSPPKVTLPVPSLINVPVVPKLITPLTTTSPVPPICNPILLPLIEEAPTNVNTPKLLVI